MPKWMLKAVIQKILSFMPAPHRLNYFFQKHVTGGVQLTDAYFEDRLIHLTRHLEAIRKFRGFAGGITVLELGTGWYPVIPIGYFLAGDDRIHTMDISRLMDRDKLLKTLEQFRSAHRKGRLTGVLDPRPDRWSLVEKLFNAAETKPFSSILETLRMHYLVADARNIPLPARSVDFISSNNTFEHIYPEALSAILLEFKRVIRADGLMSHFVDMSDHFAHLDNRISVYHFLRFSKEVWNVIDNSIQPQNRWRITHYRRLFQQLGIPVTEEYNRPGDVPLLKREPVAAEFAGISPEELAVTHSYLISVMEQGETDPGTIN